MSFTKKSIALSCAGLLLSAGAAFAQAGGPDVPSAAKGGMMHGSSMTKSHAMKSGAMMRGHMKHGTMMRSSKGKMRGHKTF